MNSRGTTILLLTLIWGVHFVRHGGIPQLWGAIVGDYRVVGGAQIAAQQASGLQNPATENQNTGGNRASGGIGAGSPGTGFGAPIGTAAHPNS